MTPKQARSADALLECIPNVSEGRDRALIRLLGDAVEAAGVPLLDVNEDVDHHRSVFTYLGAPDAVERATLALARLAVERIDMRRHQGVHPRVGAVEFVRRLEEVLIRTCAGYGIATQGIPGRTGVWTAGAAAMARR